MNTTTTTTPGSTKKASTSSLTSMMKCIINALKAMVINMKKMEQRQILTTKNVHYIVEYMVATNKALVYDAAPISLEPEIHFGGTETNEEEGDGGEEDEEEA